MPTALPPAFRENWRPIGIRTRESRLMMASTTAETTLYEHVPTVDALVGRDPRPDDREIPVRSLFAIDLEITPSLPSMGVSPRTVLGMAAGHVKRQFVRNVESDGLCVDGEETTTDFERSDGTAGKRYVLSTSAPVDPDAVDGNHSIPAETHVVVWPTPKSYGVAGGTLPLSAPDGLEDVLAIDPDGDRERILEFARTVTPGEE